MKKVFVVAALTVALMSSLSRPSNAVLDKTRFALDLGYAFFAFHHWVYNPYKAGAFAAGQPGRTKALLKGGAATLFAAHEISKADKLAHTSHSPLLNKLAGTLDSMTSSFSSLGDKLKSGTFKPTDVEAANQTVGSVGAASASAGAPVKERSVPIPGM